MFKKLLIKCDLITVTGMHIGGNDTFSAIGTVDSPVIRDAYTGYPIVPGSTLKGKLRSLLTRMYAKNIDDLPNFDDDDNKIKRIFGSSKPVYAARMQFTDCFVTNYEEMKNIGLTEVKFENAIDRRTAVANPRQLERVVPGVRFGVRITYNNVNENELNEDLEILAEGMRLLEMDYLGGHGSRGSGRVMFKNFSVTDENGKEITDLVQKFKVVSDYELLSN